MSFRDTDLHNRFRKPEYTGRNRCIPCTIVNLVIALFVSAIIGIFTVGTAAVFFIFSLITIYLRGYLVPGTPTLTKRYLPDRILALFDKGPRNRQTATEAGASSPDETRAKRDDPAESDSESTQTFETLERLEKQRQNAVDPEAFLLEVKAIEPCPEAADLCLTDSFATQLETEMRNVRTPSSTIGSETMADLFDTTAEEITIKDRPYPAVKYRRRIRKWPSDAACITDVATHVTLKKQSDQWLSVPLEQRLEMLEILRSFHDVCPQCGGEISLSEGTVESCCRVYEVLALGCTDCEEPLLEFDPEDLTDDEKQKGFRP